MVRFLCCIIKVLLRGRVEHISVDGELAQLTRFQLSSSIEATKHFFQPPTTLSITKTRGGDRNGQGDRGKNIMGRRINPRLANSSDEVNRARHTAAGKPGKVAAKKLDRGGKIMRGSNSSEGEAKKRRLASHVTSEGNEQDNGAKTLQLGVSVAGEVPPVGEPNSLPGVAVAVVGEPNILPNDPGEAQQQQQPVLVPGGAILVALQPGGHGADQREAEQQQGSSEGSNSGVNSVDPAGAMDAVQEGQEKNPMFRVSPDAIVTQEVAKMYQASDKVNREMGGSGSGGSVYGEITSHSFQKICSYLKQHMNFDRTSYFLDIGAGLGKPSLHVLLDPGVQFSFGVEIEHHRWVLSMWNLKNVLTKIARLHTLAPSVFFALSDAAQLDTLNPFTHIYMFDIAFTPELLKAIAKAYNMSQSVRCLTSYQNRKAIEEAGFNVEFHGQVKVVSHASSESHTAYVYKTRVGSEERLSGPGPFQVGFELLSMLNSNPSNCQERHKPYVEWLGRQVEEQQPDTRISRSSSRSRGQGRFADDKRPKASCKHSSFANTQAFAIVFIVTRLYFAAIGALRT